MEIEPGLLARDHHLGGRRQAHCVQEVVEQLGRVTRAALAHGERLRGDRFEDPLDCFDSSGVPADHQRERALFRRGGAAGDAGIDVLHAALLEQRVEPDSGTRGGRAQVDHGLSFYGTRRECRPSPSTTASTTLLSGSDSSTTSANRITSAIDVAARAPSCHRAFGRGVEAQHFNARPDQAASHAAAHVAQTDEANALRIHECLP
jgi:hypothetical protein